MRRWWWSCPRPFALSLSKGEWPNTKINIAGGSPATSHFLLLRQKESNPRKGDPGLPPLRGTLDQPQASGAAQLDLAGRTPRAPLRDSNIARLNLRFLAADRGGAQGMKSEKQHFKIVGWARCAHHLLNRCVGR